MADEPQAPLEETPEPTPLAETAEFIAFAAQIAAETHEHAAELKAATEAENERHIASRLSWVEQIRAGVERHGGSG